MSSGPVLTEYHVSRLMNVALVFFLQERPENKYSRYHKKEFPQICVFEISASKTLKKVSLTSERRIISHAETIQCSCFKGVKTFELLTEIMSRIWWNNSFNITTLWEHVVFTKSSDLWWNSNIGCCFDRRETYVLVSTLSAILASFFLPLYPNVSADITDGTSSRQPTLLMWPSVHVASPKKCLPHKPPQK